MVENLDMLGCCLTGSLDYGPTVSKHINELISIMILSMSMRAANSRMTQIWAKTKSQHFLI